ncbi:DNA polymerase III subunit delta [Candidatus Izemoplasma sp. B36]|uniref:DNA polymerase III subunit delta n=1 Tax=Candidatus Izemoplasma sp. B36 TaxID=3242468 RepID=UPI0035590AD7
MNTNCLLFYGDDSYLIKKNLDILFQTNEIKTQDIETYDYEEDGLEVAITNAMTLPFLADKKGVIIRNCSFLSDKKNASKEEIEALTRYIDFFNPTTLMVLLAPYEKLDSRKNIVKYLNKNIEVKDYKIKSKSDSIYDFIKDEVAKNNITIDPLALTQFVNRIGNDSTLLENELNKLITYALDKGKITSDMIYEVVTKDIDDNIFELVNAVVDREINKCMDIYQDLKSIKIDPVWMLGTISNKFQEILYTKELIKQKYRKEDIMKYFRASSGRVYYMMQNAKNVSDDRLMKILSELEELDYKIKSGQIDKFLGIELFLLNLE